MAKVFTLFKNVPEDKEGWFLSNPISSAIIDGIEVQDTDGKRQPTSIPSPFAQIDLVRAAFKSVVNSFDQRGTDLDARTDAHRLVSNALDIGQIFFQYDTHKNNLTLTSWDTDRDLSGLLDSKDGRERRLGETLRLFLNSGDALSNNFDQLDKIFILSYNNQVIGGTSPKTLFFANANALNVGVQIDCGNDRMLDDQPMALYKREKNFVKYLFYLKNQPNFGARFPEVQEYLDRTLQVLNNQSLGFANELRAEIHPTQFKSFEYPGNAGIAVNILPGFPVLSAPIAAIDYSDFFIGTDRNPDPTPMVLPTELFNHPLLYTHENWLADTQVPKEDSRPLSERTLPRVGDQHPYLTEGDFLENILIRLPYKINGSRYTVIQNGEHYLLPIKPRLFDYFSVDDLQKKGLISFRSFAGGAIQVTLKIPIQRGHSITYSRMYHDLQGIAQGDEYRIVSVDFSLGVYPFLASDQHPIQYDVAVARHAQADEIQNLKIINSQTGSIDKVSKTERSSEGIISDHFKFQSVFDAMQIEVSGHCGIIALKLLKHQHGIDAYRFTVDFGTTNTHIEYIHSRQTEPSSFALEQPFVLLRDPNHIVPGAQGVKISNEETLLHQEVIPEQLGSDKYPFPFRSVVLENSRVDMGVPTSLYTHYNIGFDYGVVSIKKHLTRNTSLKWSTVEKDRMLARSFIRQIVELCRNFVLNSNGDLNQTEITWLYPTSMSYSQRQSLKNAWEESFKEVFQIEGVENRIRSIPESIAPFYYYQQFEGLMNQTQPTVSIDMGGGTSDVTVFKQNRPLLISSFRFAGNSIFGDGFNNAVANNGFVKRYRKKVETVLKANRDQAVEELRILDAMKQQSGDDLSNFLFSLKENYNLNQHGIDIDYSKMLREDEELKLVLLLFYLASVYHVAQLMESRGIGLPKTLIYSGTAAKSLRIVDPGLKRIQEAFDGIFNRVYDSTESQIKIRLDESPKVLTAKGALMVEDDTFDVKDLQEIHIGGNTTQDNADLTYDQINDALYDQVANNVISFYKLVDKLNVDLNFGDSFGVSQGAYNKFQKLREENLQDYLRHGVDERVKENKNPGSKLEETLFFYPFIGLLHRLASELVEAQK